MNYRLFCRTLVNEQILVIARGSLVDPFLTLFKAASPGEDIGAKYARELSEKEINASLYFDAAISAAHLCIHPGEHQTTWLALDQVVCRGCQQLRDAYILHHPLQSQPARILAFPLPS